MDVVFNLDIPQDGDLTEVSFEFWAKYDNCIVGIRANCSANASCHGFEVISHEHNPPLANLILELRHTNDELIVITIKYERSSVYFVAWRRGRGEPDPNNDLNNDPWKVCGEFAHLDIPGSIGAGFTGSYGSDEDERTFLGIKNWFGAHSLQQAVVNLWNDAHVEKSFLSLCVHIAEPVRYQGVARHIRNVVSVDVYDGVRFDTEVKLFIKNWQVVSNAIEEHLESDDPNHQFMIRKEGLHQITFGQARLIMGIIKKKIIGDGN